jgi:hypothetical protein
MDPTSLSIQERLARVYRPERAIVKTIFTVGISGVTEYSPPHEEGNTPRPNPPFDNADPPH